MLDYFVWNIHFYFAAIMRERKFCLLSVRGKISPSVKTYSVVTLLQMRKKKNTLKKNYIHSVLVILSTSRTLDSYNRINFKIVLINRIIKLLSSC